MQIVYCLCSANLAMSPVYIRISSIFSLNLRGIQKGHSWLETDGLFCRFLGLIAKLYSSSSTVVSDCLTCFILAKVCLFDWFGVFDAPDGSLFWKFAILLNIFINHCVNKMLYLSHQYSGSFYYTNFNCRQTSENWPTLGWFQHKWQSFFLDITDSI